MAKNKEIKSKVKETTQASIEFSNIQGHNTNDTYALQISPEKFNINAVKAIINVCINYYSSNKVASSEEDYIGEYEVKANIYGVLTLDIKDFLEAMQTGTKNLGECNKLFDVTSVEIVELNPINTNSNMNVGLDTIKGRIETKLVNTKSSMFDQCTLNVAVLQQNISVENN